MLDRTILTPRQRALAIVAEECANAGVPVANIKSSIRCKKYVDLRTAISRRLYNEIGLSPPQIAPFIGRDRTMAIYYIYDDYRKNKNQSARARYIAVKAVKEAVAS